MKKVVLHYPQCEIEGYLNDEGQFADLNGVLLTITERIQPDRVEVISEGLPEQKFYSYPVIEQKDIMQLPEPVVKLKTILNELQHEEPEVRLKVIMNQLQQVEPEIRLKFIMNQLQEAEPVIQLKQLIGELQQEEKPIDLATIIGVLEQHEETAEFAELLGALPTEDKQELETAGFTTIGTMPIEDDSVWVDLINRYSY